MSCPLPRYVIGKSLRGGRTGFYWTLPSYYRKLGCTIHKDHETDLGDDYVAACGKDGMGGRAATLNGLLDEWLSARLGLPVQERLATFGSVDWLFREYRRSAAWEHKVSARSAPSYEATIRLLCESTNKKGVRIGSLPVSWISPAAADKLYQKLRNGPNGPRPRQAEKVVSLARRAWSVVRRLCPEPFNKDVPNPWSGVELQRRTKATKPAATREQVYAFAWKAVERGYAEVGAAAVICFEWLQRPENVLAGYVRWADYRGPEAPNMIRIEHHKNGGKVLHPLEEGAGNARVQFYQEAEEILARVEKRGIPMILRKYQDGSTKPWNSMRVNKVVRALRVEAELPATFTLDACRHGGMTELEEAELTDGQGRALSAHRSRAYEGYAKRTEKRALAATRKRYAHRLANVEGTEFQKTAEIPFQKNQKTGGGTVA